MIYDCCVRQKKCRSILKHVLKRCDSRKSCRRPVVSLSHATKSYRVNRPLCKAVCDVQLQPRSQGFSPPRALRAMKSPGNEVSKFENRPMGVSHITVVGRNSLPVLPSLGGLHGTE